MSVGVKSLSIETVVTEEEAKEGLKAALEMEIEKEWGGEGKGEGEEGSDGTQGALGALEFLTQDADPSGTTLIDACNGFNKLIRLTMLRTVQHCWLVEKRFTFNCYSHWAQLLFRQTGEPAVTIVS